MDKSKMNKVSEANVSSIPWMMILLGGILFASLVVNYKTMTDLGDIKASLGTVNGQVIVLQGDVSRMKVENQQLQEWATGFSKAVVEAFQGASNATQSNVMQTESNPIHP
jgi:type 1 fimbria pilin